MNDQHVVNQLENLDRRVERIEEILPSLATKQDLEDAIAPLATKAELAAAIAPLATKAELAAAIAPLATKAELAATFAPLATKVDGLEAAVQELRQEVKAEGERSRRYMDVLVEQQRSDIQLLAGHVLTLMSKVDRL